MKKTMTIVLSLIAVLMLASCSSAAVDENTQDAVRFEMATEDYQGALDIINSIKDNYADPVLFNLDLGLVSFYGGAYDVSIACLQQAEQQMAENRTASFSEGLGGVLTNDYAKAYPGEGYEDMYATILNAISYYKLGKLEDALVEIRRADVKLRDYQNNMSKQTNGLMQALMATTGLLSFPASDLQHLMQQQLNPDNRVLDFHGSAFATYLSMILYREAGKYDEAAIDYQRLMGNADKQIPSLYLSLMKAAGYNVGKVPWTKTDVQPAKGMARVNFISLDGLIYPKEEACTYAVMGIRTQAELTEPVAHKVAWPVIGRPGRYGLQRILVKCSNGQQTDLILLEDVTSLAEDAVAMSSDAKFLGSFYRGAMKMAGAAKAADAVYTEAYKGAMKLPGFLQEAALRAATLAYVKALEAVNETESADLRMGMFFPNTVSAGGMDLAPGTYDFSVEYTFADGSVRTKAFKGVEVGNGKAGGNIIITSCAD